MRGMSIQSVDVNTGKAVIFDETIPIEIRNKVVLSSAAIPGVFPPTFIDDLILIDGGTYSNIAIGDPIHRCQEEGVSDEDIIVDIFMALPDKYEITKWTMDDTKWKDALSFYKRKGEISSFYSIWEEVLRVTRGFPNVNFRYVVAPSVPAPSSSVITLSATKEDIQTEIN